MALKYVACTLGMLVVAVCLGGCSKSKSAKETAKTDPSVPITPASYTQRSGNLVTGAGTALGHQPFLQATLLDPPSPEELLPPEKTIAGKSVGKMYEAIAGHNATGGLWDRISLVAPDGKLKHITANMITDLGTITIELWPHIAPNHVCNFIALATVGYYNGLGFDLAVHQKVGSTYLNYLQGGCPLGTGEPGYGSIGYWLKPEFSDKVIHEEGTIGACHGESLESASTKFYITLGPAPWLDGNWTSFGKVTQGLDVARTIFQRPADDDFSPKERVLIREVTIQSQ